MVGTASPAESASAFLQRFQAARRGGVGDLAGLIRPSAAVLLDGRALAFEPGEDAEAPEGEPPDGGGDAGSGAAGGGMPGAWEILGDAPRAGGDPPQITDSAVFDASAVYVMGYDGFSETLILDRDATGWGVRLLHRVTLDERAVLDGDGPGDP